ncbi:MAG: hypothetical protein ACHP9Y_03555 [Gammaproteobacteria bacterium]
MFVTGLALGTAVYAEDKPPLPMATTTNLTDLATSPKPDRPAVKNNIDLVNRPLIAGLWAMTIPKVSCIEYYNFREDGLFVVKSAEEWSLGKYVYQLPDAEAMATTLPLLTMGIQYDSNVPDCSGNNVDQSGEVQRQYVKWIDSAHIKFCATEDGQQCELELRKILP